MGANLDITEKLQNYINNFGLNLHPVQKEIIDYNKMLGDIKRMQIDPTQCHFLHLIIKVSNIYFIPASDPGVIKILFFWMLKFFDIFSTKFSSFG